MSLEEDSRVEPLLLLEFMYCYLDRGESIRERCVIRVAICS